jgi:hypothetical protein
LVPAQQNVKFKHRSYSIFWIGRKVGIRRVIVNGSYVTAKISPNNVDIVVLPGPDYPRGEPASDHQSVRWPFLQILVATDDADLREWSLKDFGSDRNRHAKGVIEVLL